jgi:ABC-type branched-subunit amino acid transport system ATPase component
VLIDEMSTGLAPFVAESLIPHVRQVADESGPSGDLVTAGPAAELGREAAARHILKSALGL